MNLKMVNEMVAEAARESAVLIGVFGWLDPFLSGRAFALGEDGMDCRARDTVGYRRDGTGDKTT